MVDRLWAQWQLSAPQNALSFAGGSVQARDTFKNYQRYPNGGPPFLHVSSGRYSTPYNYLSPIVQLQSQVPGDGFWANVTISDVMDTRNEILCYIYE